jgi:hypothetical protein
VTGRGGISLGFELQIELINEVQAILDHFQQIFVQATFSSCLDRNRREVEEDLFMGLTCNILMLIQLSEDAALIHHAILQLEQLVVT